VSQIEFEHVVKQFGDVRAVNDLTLTVESGSFFSLLGPSGSGKTTMLRMVAGFLNATSGAIRIDGHDVTDLPPERRDLGFVFQNYALFPHLTVFENVAFGLRARRMDRAQIESRVAAVLDKTGLRGYEGRSPRELSGGEQQRVAVARALVIEPRVLLLDEPLGALDRLLREQMQFWIKDLQNETKVTTIYVTHDQVEALTMSDRIAVMHRGSIEQVGRPDSLYRQPETRFVASFMGENNIFEGRVVGPQGDALAVDTLGGLRLLAGPRDIPAGSPVVVAVRPEDIEIHAPSDGSNAAANRLAGSVIQRVYRGSVNRYQVHVEKLDRSMLVNAHGRVDTFEVGDAVALSFEPSHASVLT
jgi:spermidine/putrescine ABC transporter ATP-binding subunit